MLRKPDIIDTYTGVAFNYDAPRIDPLDVAHALAHTCRFAGHVARFISVAEHSVIVSRLAGKVYPSLALPALWHDAHEAYTGDLARPLKEKINGDYEAITERIDAEVARLLRVGVGQFSNPIIKNADALAACYEGRELKPWGAWAAYTADMDLSSVEMVVNWDLGLDPVSAREFFLSVNDWLKGPKWRQA